MIAFKIVRLAAAAGIAGGMIVATAASAQDAAAPTLSFKVSDAELLSPSGRAAIQQRIRFAAANVCSDYDARDLGRAAQADACRTHAITAANQQLDVAVARAESGTKVAVVTRGGAAVN
ncbi:MAG: UrcA family protein [Sphingomonadaceae bacterium]|nr:UrcA family protein [Sphingomonadaceae bacterium]